jgi:hypothetical protein
VAGSGKNYTVTLDNCTNGTFGLKLKAKSVTDALGNKGPTRDVVSSLSEQVIKVTTLTSVPGVAPMKLLPNPPVSVFSNLDTETQDALIASGVFAPAEGSPRVTVLTDLQNETLTGTLQITSSEQVELGSAITVSLKVTAELAAKSDLIAFMQTGDTWQYLGRTSFTGDTASSAEFTLSKLQSYNMRLVVVGKEVVTNLSKPQAGGFGQGLASFRSAVSDPETLLGDQIVDLTLEGIAGAAGVPTVEAVAEVVTVPGSQTDENAPSQPFDALATPEGLKLVIDAVIAAVVIVAATSASAGGATSSSSSESSEQDTDSSDGEISTLDAEVESFSTAKVSWGDKIPIFKLKFFTFLDVATHDLTIRLSKFFPVISKVVNDGAYLRAILGSMWLALPITGVALATVALVQPSIELRPPTWELFLAIAVLGLFDAFSGLIATLVYAVGMIVIYGINDLSDVRLMLGVLLLGFGPALIGVAFRAIRKQFETSAAYFWDRLVDIAVLTFFISWATTSMIQTLPALAGRTLVVANYASQFALLLGIAIAIRIVLEELAARGFSKRLDTINPTEVQGTSQIQKYISTALRLFIFIFVTAAFMGNVWQVWVGSFIFILPNILSWFSDRFPNYPVIWRVIPQGVPGLALTLIISTFSAGVIGGWLEGNPEYPQYLFMLLPIPMFLVGLLGMFGREGKQDEERLLMQPKWRWVYRVGGVAMLAWTMQLAGVI